MTWAEALGLYNYWVVVFLMMTGFYIVIARRNFIKSILGLNIFQTSVFLLYISMGKIRGATAPIIPPDIAAAAGHHDGEHHEAAHHDAGHAGASHAADAVEATHDVAHDAAHDLAHDLTHEAVHETVQSATGYVAMTGIDADQIVYSNPLPSVLMLTAIVVGVATTSLALALIVRVREDYGTLEEDEIQEIDRKETLAIRQRRTSEAAVGPEGSAA